MKNTITRQELKEIHDIVCQDWKTKLENYAKANPFSESISFTEEQIQEGISACNSEQLILVKKIFDIKDTWEDIKTIDDACKQLGEIDSDVRELRLLQNIPNLNRRTLAGQELIVITKALNGGWIADFDNSSQYKYILWWYLGKSFRLGSVNDFTTSSGVGAPLCYKSNEIAKYSSVQFLNIWKDYIN